MPQKLLTVKEAAEALGIPKIKIRELVDKGDLPAYKIGGKFVRFRKEQVEAIRNEILSRVGGVPGKVALQENVKPIQETATLPQSVGDQILDFFYFNDFYIVATVMTLLILFFIFS